MGVCLTKGQKVSLSKGNPGLKDVVVGLGWDVNQYDTGGDFDLDAAAFLLEMVGLRATKILYSMEIYSILAVQLPIWVIT